MKVTGINHINIEVPADQLAAVQAFYERILGLTPGPRAKSRRNGVWLYTGDQPIVHLSQIEESLEIPPKTYFHHVAFTSVGAHDFVELLKQNQIEYEHRYNDSTTPEMTQIFIFDPLRIRLEFNFSGEKL